MNSNTLHMASPPNRTAPRGALFAGALFAKAGLALSTLFATLFAKAPAAKLTRAQEAAHVRAMADRVSKTEPGFAADLYAAAARHEDLAD